MQRILHIMSGYGGGISSFIANLASHAKDKQIVFDVVTYDDCSESFYQTIQETGGKVYGLNNPKKEGWKAFIRSYEAVFQNHAYDLVHCHIAGYRAIPYAIIAKNYGVPFVIHAHDNSGQAAIGSKAKLEHFINRRVNQNLSKIQLGCGLLAIQDKFVNPKAETTFILPNAIDPQRFVLNEETFKQARRQLRAQYGLSDEMLAIGHIGRLKDVKNHEFSLKLMKWAKEQGKQCHLFIIGQGPKEDYLKQQIKGLNLEDQVTLIGRVEPIESIYPLLDLCLLPSFFEGFPTTLVETQAMGIPALVSDTVTKEVDLHLGLLAYLSLGQNAQAWWQAIDSIDKDPIPGDRRLQALEEKSLVLTQSIQVYEAFLSGRTHFQLGDTLDETIS